MKDPMTKVNFSYNFGTEKYSKEVWLCSHLGTRTNGSLSGDYLESAELLASVSETIGTSTIDVGLVAPIKKDFMSGSMIDLKIGATTCPGYIATQIALDNLVSHHWKTLLIMSDLFRKNQMSKLGQKMRNWQWLQNMSREKTGNLILLKR